MLSRQVDLQELTDAITRWLRQKLPLARDVSVVNIERSGAGLSNETFLLDVAWSQGGGPEARSLVLRCPPKSFPVYPDYDLEVQYRLMECLHAAGIPVPIMHWLEKDASVIGTPFYIMGRIDGDVPPEFPPYHSFGLYFDAPPEVRSRMWWSAIEGLAKVHLVDWKKAGISFLRVPGGGAGALDIQLDYWERYLKWEKERPDESQPIIEAGLNWLREHPYTPKRVTLCWGDARLPNVIFGKDGTVRALLDWEMAYLGDPVSDLAFFLLLDWVDSEGYGIPRLEGTPDKSETVRRYEEITGWPVENLFYQEVLAAVRAGIVMLKVYKNFKQLGVALPAEDIELNNVCTQRIAALLELPPPGEVQRGITDVRDVTALVQFHLTGSGGGDWYVVCDKGQGTRHEGVVENPHCTLTVAASDWAAIQRGEMDRLHAWTGGKLKIDGDMTLLLQLEDIISKLG